MAPQNSTLIHDDSVKSTSELDQYSPILPITNQDDNVGVWKKSILQTNNTTIEQDNEIAIWICGEPRFISGLTETTTCNEIIQALIDDEVDNAGVTGGSRDINDYVITEKWRDVEQILPGEIHILQILKAWGTARHEVKFKLKINKSKDWPKKSNTDIKQRCSDSRVYQKQGNGSDRAKIGLSKLTHLVQRILRQGECIQSQLNTICETTGLRSINKKRNRDLKRSIGDENYVQGRRKMLKKDRLSNVSPLNDIDELFLIVQRDQNKNDVEVSVEYRQYVLNQKINLKKVSKRLEISKSDSNVLVSEGKRPNVRFDLEPIEIVDSQFDCRSNSNKLKSVREIYAEIQQLLSEVDDLLAKENALQKQLFIECTKYRTENEIYTTKTALEMSIDKVQQSLQQYAKEIVQKEVEIYSLKFQISQKSARIQELKIMLQHECTNNGKCDTADNKSVDANENDVKFVDNIFEFCDTNKSIIV